MASSLMTPSLIAKGLPLRNWAKGRRLRTLPSSPRLSSPDNARTDAKPFRPVVQQRDQAVGVETQAVEPGPGR